jgi:hypothetical protein
MYLLAITCLQIILYLVWSLLRGPEWLFSFDPRVGAFVWESTLRETRLSAPGVLCWTFALMMLAVALILLITGRGLKLYLVVESLFSMPTIYAFAWIVMAGFGSPEGFPLAALEIPALIFLGFSVLPYGVAVRILAGSPSDLSILPPSHELTPRTQAKES